MAYDTNTEDNRVQLDNSQNGGIQQDFPNANDVPGTTANQPPAQQGWDANRVSQYFASRGVTPAGTSPDYWAQKWQEWGKNDPSYFEQRLSQADEFGGGGHGGGGGSISAPDMSASTYASGYPSAQTTNIPTYTPFQMNAQAPDVSNAFQTGQSGGIVNNPTGASNTLYGQLAQRAGQSLNLNPLTDSIIKPQMDAYNATQTRQARGIIDDSAEGGNPYATGALQGARTQAAEAAGQNSAQQQAGLTAQEMAARRADIAGAQGQQGQMLTADQQLNFQRQQGQVGANLQKYATQGGFELQGNAQNNAQQLGIANLGLQQQGITNQNSQFYNGLSQQDQQFLKNLQLQYGQLNLQQQGLNSNNDQFASNYGLNYNQQKNYWDAVNSGKL